MKDKIRYKNKIKKKQLTQIQSEQMISASKISEPQTTDDNCGVSEAVYERLKNELSELSGAEFKSIRDSSLEKMSGVILEYGEPIIDTIDSDDKEAYDKAILMTTVLWNSAIMYEEPKNRKKAYELLKPLMFDDEAISVVSYMLARKRLLFPDNKRYILNYELTGTQGDFHLTVSSTTPAGYKESQ